MSEVDRKQVAEWSWDSVFRFSVFFCHGYYTTMHDKWHQSQGFEQWEQGLGQCACSGVEWRPCAQGLSDLEPSTWLSRRITGKTGFPGETCRETDVASTCSGLHWQNLGIL